MNIIVNTSDASGITFKLADYRNVAAIKDKKAFAERYSKSASQVALFGGDPSLLFSLMRAQLVGVPQVIDLPAQFIGGVAANQMLFRAQVPANLAAGNRFKIQVFRNGVKLDEGDNFFFVVAGGAVPPPVLPACADSIDNDADGVIDYPNDPGCFSPSDIDESNAVTPPPAGVLPDTLTATLISANQNKAGVWNVFGPGNGNAYTKTPYDWEIEAKINTEAQNKIIKSVEFQHNCCGESWSSQNSAKYPVVVFENGVQKNTAYGKEIYLVGAGVHTLRFYEQIEYTTFTGGSLTIIFTDGTSLSATLPSSSTIKPPTPIVASCSVNPTTQVVGNSVLWNATASGGSGSFSYVWSGFGMDGATGPNVTIAYATPGTYTGSVTVTSGTEVKMISCGSVTVTASVASDEIKALRVDQNLNPITNTSAGLNSTTNLNSVNPASFAAVRFNLNTLYVTDVAGAQETFAACAYPLGGTECSITPQTFFSPTMVCSNGFCSTRVSFDTSITSPQVVKVVVKYTSNVPPVATSRATVLASSELQSIITNDACADGGFTLNPPSSNGGNSTCGGASTWGALLGGPTGINGWSYISSTANIFDGQPGFDGNQSGGYRFVLSSDGGVTAANSIICTHPAGAGSWSCGVGTPVTPFITVVSPNGGEVWQTGTNQTIQWTSSGISAVNVILYTQSGAAPASTILASNIPNTGSYSWSIPVSLIGRLNDYRILVQGISSSGALFPDNSDASFTINSVIPPAPTIAVTSPTVTSIWTPGTTQNITWNTASIDPTHYLGISVINADTGALIMSGTVLASEGRLPWAIPANAPAGNFRIRIVDNNVTPNVFAESPIFRIDGQQVFALNQRVQIVPPSPNIVAVGVRQGPGDNFPRVAILNVGEQGVIAEAPAQLVAGVLWWHVRFDNGVDGWVPQNALGPVQGGGAALGDVRIFRVDQNLALLSPATTTLARILTSTTTPINPANFLNVPLASTTAYATDLPGMSESYAICTYPRGGVECQIASSTSFTTSGIFSSNGFVYTNVPVVANTVTKVVFKYELTGANLFTVRIVDTAARNVLAGSVGANLSEIRFDATAFDEDLRVFWVRPALDISNGALRSHLTSCQLFDGTLALNTGFNIVNPTGSDIGYYFSFDNPLVLAKGTTKTLSLRCNVASNAIGTFNWGLARQFGSPLAYSIGTVTGGSRAAINFEGPGPNVNIQPAGSPVGDVRIFRVDQNLALLATSTLAQVTGRPTTPLNPGDFLNLNTGSTTAFVTDLPGYVETYASCTYLRGGSECLIASSSPFYSFSSVSNGFVSASTSVFANTVTKIFAKYVVAPQIFVTRPNNGEMWQRGTQQALQWISTEPMTVALYASIPGGSGSYTIVLPSISSVAGLNTYSWTVGQGVGGFQIPNGQYNLLVQCTSANCFGQVRDLSDQPFTISDAVAAGTLSFIKDSSAPGFQVAAAGTVGNTVDAVSFTALNESIVLNRIGINLIGTKSFPGDVVQATVWDGATQVGSAVFVGNDRNATSTPMNVLVAQNIPKVLKIKLDLSPIGVFQVVTTSGHQVAVGVNTIGGVTFGTGVTSGNFIPASGSSGSLGLLVYKSFPVFTYSTVGGTLTNGMNDLLVLNVRADGGPNGGEVVLNRLMFRIVASTTQLSNLTFFGPNGNVASSTSININASSSPIFATVFFDSLSNTQDRIIPVGSTKTYVLRGIASITGPNSTGFVSTALLGDQEYPRFMPAGTFMSTVNELFAYTMAWSPVSTTTGSTITTRYRDWTNAFGLPGCFALAGLGNDCASRVIAR
jgi:hypothetical protein